MRRLLYLLILGLAMACAGRKTTSEQVQAEALPPVEEQSPRAEAYHPTFPPAELEGQAQRSYLRDHYWDNYDFRDPAVVERYDSLSVAQAIAFYVARVVDPMDGEAVGRMMDSAAVNPECLRFFHRVGRTLLYDAASPLRNDEHYIALLESLLNAPYLDEVERIQPTFELQLVSQNRVGSPANEIRFTTFAGQTYSLYGLNSTYTLLFFSNPGCPMCAELQAALQESPMLSQLIEQRQLTLVMLYPDEDLEAWRAYEEHIPKSWIYAYDAEQQMRRSNSYDLRAIPSLYLLDRQKRVLLKDVYDVAWVEHTLDHRL